MRKLSRIIATAIFILSTTLPTPSTAQVDETVRIGAYDPAHLNGLVLITDDQNFFGLRFLVYRPGAPVEEAPRSFDLGPHAPDGSSAKVTWLSQLDDQNPITLRWSRLSKNVVSGRLTAPPNVRIVLEVYRPWGEGNRNENWATFWAQPDRRTILGEQVQNQKSASSLRRFFLRADRAAAGAASYEDTEAMRKTLVKEGHAQQAGQSEKPGPYHHAALSFDHAQDQSFGFVALVGDNFDAMEREADNLLQKPIAESLAQAEKNYDSTRASSSGAIGASFEAVTRAVNWNRFYDPEKQLVYVVNHRLPSRELKQKPGAEVNPSLRGNVLSWDTFLTATMAAMVDAGSAKSTIHALLEGQTPDGRVPLRRHIQSQPRHEPSTLAGRSMPPVGALCVWKVYLATNDLELLAWAYPRLLQWNDWWLTNRGDGQPWRDGNGDGLIEWGFDAELERGALGARMMENPTKLRLAFSESGLEDRPQWSNGEEIRTSPSDSSKRPDASKQQNDDVKYNDRTRTVEFSPVALNALYAHDTEILIMMARELGLLAEAEKLQARYERIKYTINNKLWSEEDGLYLNRHWDGRFSRRLSLENFYPLIAGVADEEKAKRMMKTLSDPRKFGGEQPFPFISRDDPVFTDRGTGRGAIWSLTNYFLYLGLRRYSFYDEAAELARKSALLARLSWEKNGKFYDHFSSRDGAPIDEGVDAQPPRFTGLLFWPGIEEVISVDLWAGMSVGSPSVTEESRIERAPFSGALFDVISGPKQTVVKRGGNIEVECDGPVRLRAYRGVDRALSFTIETKQKVRVMAPAVEGRKITVSVDDKVLGSTSPGAAASFKAPPGSHKIFIVK
jgi:hypothetical protein